MGLGSVVCFTGDWHANNLIKLVLRSVRSFVNVLHVNLVMNNVLSALVSPNFSCREKSVMAVLYRLCYVDLGRSRSF